MQFSEHDLRAAVAAGALDDNSLSRLLDFLATRQSSVPRIGGTPAAPAPQFDLAHLLWYAGALIVMSAMGLFSTLAFSSMGGFALAATAVVYAILFTVAGHHLWYGRDLRIPGGLLIAIAVSMAPSRCTASRTRSAPGASSAGPAPWMTSTSGSKAAGCSWKSPPSWRR